MERVIYHLVSPSWWQKFEGKEEYESETLEEEGFMHLSTKSQVEGTLNNYFKGTELLLLLHIETNKLDIALIYENLHGHGEFPHIYGPLNISAVINVEEIRPKADGSFFYPNR